MTSAGNQPLLAVCGLCGGAGASTLAYLVAQAAAHAGDEPVLVCDSGGPTGGLAGYAAAESSRSLPSLANAIAAHEPLAAGLFADAGPRLRVLATRPRLDADVDPDGLARLLHDAREAHALTVVDCGVPSCGVDEQVLEDATHVVWVLPATVGAVRRCERTLALFHPHESRREIVVARHDPAGRKAPIPQLTDLAAGRNAPLVLMPDVPDLAEQPQHEALEAVQLSLDALLMAVRR